MLNKLPNMASFEENVTAGQVIASENCKVQIPISSN
jgi:hypothetical protein